MPTYTKITSYTVPSATHSVTISGIPNTYTDLVIKCALRSDYGFNTHEGQFILNSITSSDYTQTLALGETTSTLSAGPTNAVAATWGILIAGSASTANTFSNSTTYISNYANTSIQKSWTVEAGVGQQAGQQVNWTVGGFCNTTAAVSSITFYAWQSFINFVAGSTFTIYGISNA